VVSCRALWCASLLMDRVIQSPEGEVSYVRDVGIAGSNPVTPTNKINKLCVDLLFTADSLSTVMLR
jgi:hypothetical protein